TKYDPDIIPYIQGADLLYHEATFLKEKAIWAEKTFHATTDEAGKIAKAANVGQLIIGHYSARYKELDIFLEEAKEEFEQSMLAIEGETITIDD
ncbi:MAG: ribonuclease Z, partial [Fulvivirga sp.]|nr:ribonuclease Z [Fulvivirga sp.]